MKALIKAKKEPGLWLEDIKKPEPGINDVLIKIQKTGICGTDIHIYNWDEWAQKTIPVPMAVGHEFVGVIEDIGSNVKDYKPGDIVSGEGHVICGRCRNCLAGRRHLCKETQGVGVNRPGAFAEYLSIPMSNVWHANKKIQQDLLAIFDPFGNAVHTALSFDLLGEDVLIVGAGPIGIMAVAVAKHAGARNIVITDVNEYRLSLAKEMGATVALNIKEGSLEDVQKNLDMHEGFDVGMGMTGNPQAIQDLLKNMVHGGKIALLGIPEAHTEIDWNLVVFNGLTIKGIYGREMYETWYKMESMLLSGLNIDPIITHRFDVDDFQEGFEIMNSGNSGKIILNWD